MQRCFRKFRPHVSVQHALGELRCLETLYTDMIKKYERERDECLIKFKQASSKSEKMRILRKRKMLSVHIGHCESRITSCAQRQYSLEQLELTRMQIKAVETTSKVFRKFTKYQSIQRVEDMQDNMEELMDVLTDMNDLLAEPIVQLSVDDEMDIEAEFAELNKDPEEPEFNLPEAPTNTIITIGEGREMEAV